MMKGYYMEICEGCKELTKQFHELDKGNAVAIGKQDVRIEGVESDVGEVKEDIKEIRSDIKNQTRMLLGMLATTILTLIGMVVNLLR